MQTPTPVFRSVSLSSVATTVPDAEDQVIQQADVATQTTNEPAIDPRDEQIAALTARLEQLEQRVGTLEFQFGNLEGYVKEGVEKARTLAYKVADDLAAHVASVKKGFCDLTARLSFNAIRVDADIDSKMAAVKSSLEDQVAGFAGRMKALEAETDDKFSALGNSLNEHVAVLQSRIDFVTKEEFESNISRLLGKMHTNMDEMNERFVDECKNSASFRASLVETVNEKTATLQNAINRLLLRVITTSKEQMQLIGGNQQAVADLTRKVAQKKPAVSAAAEEKAEPASNVAVQEATYETALVAYNTASRFCAPQPSSTDQEFLTHLYDRLEAHIKSSEEEFKKQRELSKKVAKRVCTYIVDIMNNTNSTFKKVYAQMAEDNAEVLEFFNDLNVAALKEFEKTRATTDGLKATTDELNERINRVVGRAVEALRGEISSKVFAASSKLTSRVNRADENIAKLKEDVAAGVKAKEQVENMRETLKAVENSFRMMDQNFGEVVETTNSNFERNDSKFDRLNDTMSEAVAEFREAVAEMTSRGKKIEKSNSGRFGSIVAEIEKIRDWATKSVEGLTGRIDRAKERQSVLGEHVAETQGNVKDTMKELWKVQDHFSQAVATISEDIVALNDNVEAVGSFVREHITVADEAGAEVLTRAGGAASEIGEACEQPEQTENVSQESTDAGNEPSSQQASVTEQQEEQAPAAASIAALTQEVADPATEENAATNSSPSLEALEQGLRNRLTE
jgi:hypothetical protein